MVALVHDYLTQRGGAERVVLAMLKAFPQAPLYTSLYEPESTFPDFRSADIRTPSLDRVGVFRKHHRLALPLLAATFARLDVPGDVVLCSSSGWAHGVRTEGRKIVYCYSPARWLYQSERYLPKRRRFARAALGVLRPQLARWDRHAASRADRYLTTSDAVSKQIREIYGIEAEVLPPPPPLGAAGAQEAIPSLEPGFFLCVSRLMPYKNVDQVIDAFAGLSGVRLVVVGTGPEEQRLRRQASSSVSFLNGVGDDQLRWLYTNSAGVVAASYEDYGLTPLEAAALGSPAVVLRWGGFRETVVEGVTGVFFDRPEARLIREAVGEATAHDWKRADLQAHAARYSERAFLERLQAVVAEEAAQTGISSGVNGLPLRSHGLRLSRDA